MHIAIDIRPTQLSSKGRGIGRYIYDLVAGLTRQAPQHQYLLIAFSGTGIPERFLSLPSECCTVVPLPTLQLQHLSYLAQRYRWEKLPPVWAVKCAYNRTMNARRLTALVRQSKVDVLHLTSAFEPTFFTDGNYPCPTVKTFYDATPLMMPDDFLRRWPYQVRTVYRREVQGLMTGCDALVAISESAKQDAVEQMGVSAERVRVVYPAIADSFQPVSDPARLRRCREALGIGDRPFFLFCSGGGANKNRERAVRAFAQGFARHPQGRNYVLVMAGPPGGDEDTLRQIARDEGITDESLLLTGFVSDEDLVNLFSSAIALFSPSLYEGFGLPAAQALQMGLPVIASNRSSLPEVVGDVGLLIDPTDLESMVAALTRIATDSALREELGRRGRARASRFEGHYQAEAYLNLYAELAAARHRATMVGAQ